MAQRYSFAELGKWAAKTKKRTHVVVQQATNDMIRDVRVVPAMARGGTPQEGTIPRDIGALAASLQSELHGSTSLSGSGEDSYTLVVGQMQAGDVAQFTWGGNAAPYARRIHYGWGTYPGTFWRDIAAGKWDGYVRAAVVKAKARVA